MADPLHVAVYARNERELIRSIGWSAATLRMVLEAPL
jgi:hypothetical protein